MDKEKENEFNTAYDLYDDMLYKIAYLHTADKDESEGFEIQHSGLDEATGEKDYVMTWQHK